MTNGFSTSSEVLAGSTGSGGFAPWFGELALVVRGTIARSAVRRSASLRSASATGSQHADR